MAAIPPALRYRVLDVVARLGRGDPRDPIATLLEIGAGWLGAEPSLVDLGMWLVEPARDAGLRALGCSWLAMFPTVDAIERLAAIALEPQPVPAVRAAAGTALAPPQLRGVHPAAPRAAHAIQLAHGKPVQRADGATTDG